jgi:hypothetical protein
VGQPPLEPKLVHDPPRLLPARGPAAVEHERLLHADEDAAAPEDLLVLAGGLPVAALRGAVRARARGVLSILVAEEVPLLPHLSLGCKKNSKHATNLFQGQIFQREGTYKAAFGCEYILMDTSSSSTNLGGPTARTC